MSVTPNATTTEVQGEDFDAFVILGGSIRVNPNVIRLIREAIALQKWVVAIGTGSQVLIEADLLSGKQVTGFRAIRKDIENAGAAYIDTPTAVDTPLITARRPGDLPIVMSTLFRLLKISTPDQETPLTNYLHDHDWWALGEAWGGTSRAELVKGAEHGHRGRALHPGVAEAVQLSGQRSQCCFSPDRNYRQ